MASTTEKTIKVAGGTRSGEGRSRRPAPAARHAACDRSGRRSRPCGRAMPPRAQPGSWGRAPRRRPWLSAATKVRGTMVACGALKNPPLGPRVSAAWCRITRRIKPVHHPLACCRGYEPQDRAAATVLAVRVSAALPTHRLEAARAITPCLSRRHRHGLAVRIETDKDHVCDRPAPRQRTMVTIGSIPAPPSVPNGLLGRAPPTERPAQEDRDHAQSRDDAFVVVVVTDRPRGLTPRKGWI